MTTPRRSIRLIQSPATRSHNMDINSLLNHDDDPLSPSQSRNTDREDPGPVPRSTPSTMMKIKAEKDMPSYRKQQPVLEVKYPPHIAQPDSLEYDVQRYHNLYPPGDISQYAAHIPYSSSKTQFQEKTGRTAVEVFMYEFRVPDDESKGRKRYPIYWDYNFGLVRMTNIYKACGLAKVVPRKALQMNPGLIDISHSLTGGNLEAQGYWVPFEAAKAIASKFAYAIRYLLTPIFGIDFPDTCVAPDTPEYRNYRIDPSIVQRCAEQTKEWLTNATKSSPSSAPPTSALSQEHDISESTPEPSTAANSPFPSPKKKAKRPLLSKRPGLKRLRAEYEGYSASPSPDSDKLPLLPDTEPSSTTSGVPTTNSLSHRSPVISPRSVLLEKQYQQAAYASSSSAPPPLRVTRASTSSSLPFWQGFGPAVNHPLWNPINDHYHVYQGHSHSHSEPTLPAEHEAAMALLEMQSFPVFGTVEGAIPGSNYISTSSASTIHGPPANHGVSATKLAPILPSEPESPRAVKRLRPSSR